MLVGTVSVIISLIVISYTDGVFNGGIYNGIFAIFAASTALRIRTVFNLHCLTTTAFISFVVAIVASAVLGAEYNWLNDVKACASDCVGGSCTDYGSTSYYAYANICSYSNSDWDCSCVTSSSSSTCYNINNLPTCNVLFEKLPGYIHSAFSVSVITIFASFIMLCAACTVTMVPRYREEVIVTEVVVTEHLNPSRSNQPTVVTADAYYATSVPVTVVPATSVAQSSSSQKPIQGTVISNA